MKTPRSEKMVLVGYFLSRCGSHSAKRRYPRPPLQLKVDTWNEAYRLFFPKLNGGRDILAFHNTLKNSRDLFDGHLDSGRAGWRDGVEGRPPLPLSGDASKIKDTWSERSDEELWRAVKRFADSRVRGLSDDQIEKLTDNK